MAEEKETFNIDKTKEFSDWYSRIVEVAELADLRNDVKGFIVFRPWAVRSMMQMYALYIKALESKGHWPAWFPALIPERLLEKEKEHLEGFAPGVFWVEKGGNTKLPERYFLRPTSETPMYDMYSKWISSWRDLPLKIYQACQVWRYETKATRPFIRSREFWWIEAHDCFETEQEAVVQVKEDMQTTEKIMHQQFGIPFLFFRRPEWDKFPGAQDTFAADTLTPDGKIIQQPSTHLLGQKFSKPFEIMFKDKNEKKSYVWQTCYGPAISRMFASVIATHGDENGLVFPWAIAPLQVIIIPIVGKDGSKVLDKTQKLKKLLEDMDIRAMVDDSDKRPGEKYYFWEMKGVPIRIELGNREVDAGELTLFRRDTKEKWKIKETNLLDELKKTGEDMRKTLLERADKAFKGKIHDATNMQELINKLKLGGFVRVNICSREMDGRECADEIKHRTGGADVRGSLPFEEEKPTGPCVFCKNPAKAVVYVGKSY